MRNYRMEAFIDEMGDIVKQADVMKDVGGPIKQTPSLKDRILDIAGPHAGMLAFGAVNDVMGGRNLKLDMRELAGKLRSPSTFGDGIGEGAKMYAMGPGKIFAKNQGMGNRIGQGMALLGTGMSLLEAKDAFKKQDPTGEGRSRAARLSGLAGRIGGGILGSRMGMTAGLITGMAGDAVGRGVGAGIDYLTKYKPPSAVTNRPTQKDD